MATFAGILGLLLVVFCVSTNSLPTTKKSIDTVTFDVGVDCLRTSTTTDEFIDCFYPSVERASLSKADLKRKLEDILDPLYGVTVLLPLSSSEEQRRYNHLNPNQRAYLQTVM